MLCLDDCWIWLCLTGSSVVRLTSWYRSHWTLNWLLPENITFFHRFTVYFQYYFAQINFFLFMTVVNSFLIVFFWGLLKCFVWSFVVKRICSLFRMQWLIHLCVTSPSVFCIRIIMKMLDLPIPTTSAISRKLIEVLHSWHTEFWSNLFWALLFNKYLFFLILFKIK